MATVNEYWRWTEATGWRLHVRPLSRAEWATVDRLWGRS